jgi:ADP-heptose:LPS heptosyltransferase
VGCPDSATPLIPPASVRRIAVFRALMLGDLLCAVPTLRAVRAAYPEAEITLVGLRWAQAWVQRLRAVDRFVAFPGYPGLAEQPPQLDALPAFLADMQARRFDLALQLHGSGGVSNPLVASFGARHTAGFFQPGQFCPEPRLFTPWPEHGHEIERCLALTDALGLPRQGEHLDLPVDPADRERLRALWPHAFDAARPFVVVHPGSQLASRRWPVQRFAEVADALAARGLAIVVTGTAGEAALTAALQALMQHDAVDLTGRTDLWMLGALLERASLLVSNDTGLSHVATALRTPSVIVSSGADVARWAPLDAARHRVLWHDLPCRPCAHAHCPTQHECATAIPPERVIAAALSLLEQTIPTPWPTTNACASSPGTCTATTCTT